MENPRSCHLLTAKKILRHIKGTVDFRVLMINHKNSRREENAYGYFESDWGGDQDDIKSTVGYLLRIGEAPSLWNSMKQCIISLSSYEL